ncbi:ubiquitin-associated protein 2-like [Oryzias melastigma]|uniref:ubiquitin-associated protein 2-like n=1 Tax=Oryzias melastigma TaxID=30732 RepID=UPI000CF7D62B|nr:ubiquitin-associated protein 2-like [Oryzias melastigma]
MISDHNDADFEEKVKQLVDITGKDQDESMIALHDCNGDLNRAINVLLEGNPDTVSPAAPRPVWVDFSPHVSVMTRMWTHYFKTSFICTNT